MILETVIFTALPQVRRGNTLLLSVFISPQLGGEEGNPRRLPLSRYTDFADGAWTRIIQEMEWEVVIRWSRDDTDEVYLPARRTSPDPDATLSSIMLPSTMPVDPFRFDNPARVPFLSFPTAMLDGALGNAQVEVARRSPESRPPIDTLVTRYKGQGQPRDQAPLDPFVLGPARTAALDAVIDAQLASGVTKAPEPGQAGATAQSVRMLDRFLQPQATPAELEVPPEWPDLDFHGALSMLSVHPQLLRRLGFIVDLEASLAGVRDRSGTPRVFVSTSWPGPYDPDARGVDITTAYPRVLTKFGATDFRVAPRGGGLTSNGFVATTNIAAVTSDVAVETLATQTEATGLSRMMSEGLEAFGTPTHAGMPARRSSGITLARRNEPLLLRQDMERMEEFWDLLARGDDLDVTAEDVLVGYRVDIRPRGGQRFRTLHRRLGFLTPYKPNGPGDPVDLGVDEGWVEPAGTGEMDVGGVAPLRIVDTLAHWTGWSLSIPEPGLSLDASDGVAPDPGPGQAQAVIDTLHGVIDYRPPPDGAQLPILRFTAQGYEIRMRWVDLSGYSVPLTAGGSQLITTPYLRHEPVAAPALYLAEPPVWRESVDVVVLRTGVDRSLNRATSRRYAAAAQVSADLCVTHGMFDDANGVPRADAYDTIATRESAYLPEGVLARPPEAVPYLPDPLAVGMLVRGVPRAAGAYDAESSLRFGGRWPDVPLAVIDVSATARAGASVSGPRMTVGVPRGRVAELRISSAMTAAGLGLLDLWRRIKDFSREDRARLGAYWQLTPDRILTVVHAVQVPNQAPAFVVDGPRGQRWAATRTANETAAILRGSINVDAPSTESLSITGTAEVAVDNGPGTPAPYVDMARELGVLGTTEVADAEPEAANVNAFVLVRAAFDDTRRVGLTLRAEATSRFAEYFRQTQDFESMDRPVTLGNGGPIVAGSAQVTWSKYSDGPSVTAKPEQYSINLATGVFTRIGAPLPEGERIPLGSFMRVTWLPEPISLSSSRASAAAQRSVRVPVPSSARPLPPEVAWIVPTFRWDGPTGANRRSTRFGGGLRIYLERPWWSSGIGEDLAVVLRASDAPDSSTDDLVTQWALDATRTGADVPESRGRSRRFPGPIAFTNKSATTPGVVAAEFPTRVDIARYAVGRHDRDGVPSGYDPDRDMWFVDMEIDAGSAYRPFLRLALARYQSQATASLNLSPIVLVDVVQLEPNRVATMSVRDGAVGASRLSLALSGPTYASNEIGSGPGKAIAILERYVGGGPVDKSASSAAWEAVTTIDLTGTLSGGSQGSWTGTLDVPAQREVGRYRVVLEQYEYVRTDGLAAAYSSLTAAQKREVTGLRLVHQDILAVPRNARR